DRRSPRELSRDQTSQPLSGAVVTGAGGDLRVAKNVLLRTRLYEDLAARVGHDRGAQQHRLQRRSITQIDSHVLGPVVRKCGLMLQQPAHPRQGTSQCAVSDHASGRGALQLLDVGLEDVTLELYDPSQLRPGSQQRPRERETRGDTVVADLAAGAQPL